MDRTVIATISTSGVEYALENAYIGIDELIEQLEEAKAEGATHVVGTSGNYRGAQWVRLGRVTVEEPEEDYED